MYLVASLILLSISDSYAGGKFIKVENCTSTNKSLNIARCDIVNGALFLGVDIFRPVDKVFVSRVRVRPL